MKKYLKEDNNFQIYKFKALNFNIILDTLECEFIVKVLPETSFLSLESKFYKVLHLLQFHQPFPDYSESM